MEALTVDILKDIAKEYDTPFDTAYTTIQEFDADEEDLGSKIRDGLNKLFFKNHKTIYGYDGITNADFEFSARYGEFTWLDYQPTNERYVIHVKEFEKEINNITREYIQIEDIFDALDITLNLEENKQGFKTYTKFKGKSDLVEKDIISNKTSTLNKLRNIYLNHLKWIFLKKGRLIELLNMRK